jgi:hypothetical protein
MGPTEGERDPLAACCCQSALDWDPPYCLI